MSVIPPIRQQHTNAMFFFRHTITRFTTILHDIFGSACKSSPTRCTWTDIKSDIVLFKQFTQDGNTGTLKTALRGADTETVVILGDADDTFSSSKDLVIDSTNPVTVLADDITAVNQALQSAPSNFGFGNVFSNHL